MLITVEANNSRNHQRRFGMVGASPASASCSPPRSPMRSAVLPASLPEAREPLMVVCVPRQLMSGFTPMDW